MNILVIGLGSMGRRRVRLIKAMNPEYLIIGVDSNTDRAGKVAEEYQITCVPSMESVTAEEIACAFVCTSPLSHADIITKCLKKGWHVFTEINLVSDAYERNQRLAKEKGLILFLSSTLIYRAEMIKIREKLYQNGRPVSYNYHVGQYLPDWHPWESFQQFFVGDERTNGCREIMAIELPWMVKAFGPIVSARTITGKLTKLDIDYNDHYLIQIQHQNGTHGVLVVDVVCRQAVRHLEIFNEEIYLEWNGTPDSLLWKNTEKNEMEKLSSEDAYAQEAGYSAFVNEYAYVNELKEFFEVMENRKKMAYTFEEDAEILKWIDRIEGK